MIDTNVCLDLFVFRDPRWSLLLQGLQSGELDAITREDCRKEWQIVLGYSHLKLDTEQRAKIGEEFDALIRCHSLPASSEEALKLPVCKDKDDQKFLEVARDHQAAVLITKDKALLKLAKRTRREGLFAILTPETWTASQLEYQTSRTAA
ncbi:putative toxin-antitoxin system toxin component, PIN family [uncultured Oxalicibacterium sp.]|uniref:putative toxin-antitoxin system toxin component, PIN family n=1 Tax=uncultured Oxalicibacterium sp. TaxID=1168540 RepID=UPI003454530C